MNPGAFPRWLSLGLLLAGCLCGCTTGNAVSGGRNCVAAYLTGAQQQLETEGQLKEIQRALQDMLAKSPEDLHSIRYADYEGRPGMWTAVQLLHRYFVPKRDVLDEECFYRDVSTPEARAAIRRQLDLLLRSPASTK